MMLNSPFSKAHTFFYYGVEKKVNFPGMKKATLHTSEPQTYYSICRPERLAPVLNPQQLQEQIEVLSCNITHLQGSPCCLGFWYFKAAEFMQPWGEFEYFWGERYENIYFAYLISSLDLHADVKIGLCVHALAILLTNNQK